MAARNYAAEYQRRQGLVRASEIEERPDLAGEELKRAVLRAIEADDLTHAEIAEALGVSQSAVAQIASRAKRAHDAAGAAPAKERL